ncbi:MAG: EMC3/TMCO1 family protein [Candidatus Aenigmarchaeota archaeon]|nr:EMC3/TMCO1 family protein [Candidatus Aenigmarchaeota archaeon]
MIEIYYNALNAMFGPALGLHPALGELIVAAFITFIITIFYKYLLDQNKVKELKDKTKELQQKLKETKDKEETNKLTSEMFGMSNQQMKMTFKPMILTLIFVISIFPWLKVAFPGQIVTLPFEILGRTSFGWFLWYIIVSFPLSIGFRKLMGVNL